MQSPRSRAISSRGRLVYLMTILTKIDIFRFMSRHYKSHIPVETSLVGTRCNRAPAEMILWYLGILVELGNWKV